MWLKNTAGQPSASLTFAFIGFIVVTLWLVVSIIAKVGNIEIRQFDSAQAMGYLLPLLALYFGRRWTDGKGGTLDTAPTGLTVQGKSTPEVEDPASASNPPSQPPSA